MIYREGDILACEQGHPVFRMKTTRSTGDVCCASDVESADPRIAEPKKGSAINPECWCGARWSGATMGINPLRVIRRAQPSNSSPSPPHAAQSARDNAGEDPAPE